MVVAINGNELKDAIDEFKTQTPPPMNAMLDKQPRYGAVEKREARDTMTLENVPPTNPGTMQSSYNTRNTCMQQPLALIGIQRTIFSEHEVFRVYDFQIVFDSFLHFQYFSKNVKIMKVLSVLITKYIICTFF